MMKLVHVLALVASFLDHSQPHLHSEHNFELDMANITPRRVIAR